MLYRITLLLSIILSGAAGCVNASAQQFALKTNILYDATATINLGAEMRVAPRWSVDVSANYNSWTLGNERRWKHWLVQPEARYWLCEATAGHFFALHALGGQFNVGHLGFAHDFLGYKLSRLRDNRYQGWFVGAGIGYGYAWTLGTHWTIEAEIALGWIHANYDKYECAGCGRRIGKGTKNYFAPTKAAVDIVYVF